MFDSSFFLSLFALVLCGCNQNASADYQIGVGRADCTGPAAEIIFMGYAKITQFGCGLHLRQFSRAYIIDDGDSRAVFVTVDTAMMSHGLRREVLKRLEELYNDTYTEQNLIISGTHTHSTPGGFMMDLMLDISILGFVVETFNALADGITQSIINAHENIVDGKIFVNSGELLDANINRSPASYLMNPEEERKNYEYDTDKTMVQLKFVRSSDNKAIGAINWFAVHATSMNNTNCRISSDNVGLASILFEKDVSDNVFPGKGDFVGAFASTNLGDVSPNTKGPICIDTGEECDFITSACSSDNTTKYCIASGPGENMIQSTEIIAKKLYGKGKELFQQEDAFEVSGPVKFIHQYVDMPKETVTITLENGTRVEEKGCLPAMGYSFAGGTTDGPGEFDFTQGTLTDNPFWDAVRDFLFPPSEEQVACHAPKPVLINSGEVELPYSWQPQIVSTQMFLIGEVALIAVPGEFTTMSGRRLRDAVKATIVENGGSANVTPIIAGLSNVYTNYIATREEYGLQRYEGASTIFGPHTLNIYLQKYKQLAEALCKGEALDAGPTPGDFTSDLLTLVPPVLFDGLPVNSTFGEVLDQPQSIVSKGETVKVAFRSGNPRNNVLHGDSFLFVERQVDDEEWHTVATDAMWETRLTWERTDLFHLESRVIIEWDVDENATPGIHRIRHQGHYKDEATGEIKHYEGVSDNFTVQ